MKYLFFTGILFLSYSLNTFGQSGFFNHNSLQTHFYAGKIVKNYPVFPKSGLSSLIAFSWQRQTKKTWASYYGYPKFGMAVVLGDFGNSNELGNVVGLMPEMIFTIRKTRKIPIHLTLGWGYGYWTKKYDAITNPNNMAIGSSITNMAFFSATMPISLSEQIRMNLGISTTHFSNGHYRMPNNGINIPSVVVGINFGNDTIQPKPESEKFIFSKWQYLFQAGSGLHDFGDGSKPIGGPLYPVYAFTSGITRQINHSGKIHTGLYVNYYTDFYDYVMEKQLFRGKETSYALTGSIYLGYEFIFGKFSMMVESGWYVWNPFYKYYKDIQGQKDFKTTLKKYINNKMGFQYYPFAKNGRLKGLYLGTYIRANFGQADFTEYAAGIVF